MPTTLMPNPPPSKRQVVLKTWTEAKEYFAKHLIPVAHGPKGQPIYSHRDIQNLNVQLPEEIGLLSKDSE